MRKYFNESKFSSKYLLNYLIYLIARNALMENQLANIKNILLMGPGPSCVSDSVYEALSKTTHGHLDP